MASRIHIGVGGWVYEPWRNNFYPEGLTQKRELEYAARHLTAIEINGTYYGSQKPESFARWHDQTPEDFIFTVKGPRFATNRRVLAEAGGSIEKFFASGVGELKNKLGAVNWQFMATKKFDAADFEAFLKLLPRTHGGRAVRHAVEVRNDSFRNADFVALCRAHQVAIVVAGDGEFPLIPDVTADFVYARLLGTKPEEKLGYSKPALGKWAARVKSWAKGGYPGDMKALGPQKAGAPRDVFCFLISGAKEKNPAAAMALIEQVAQSPMA